MMSRITCPPKDSYENWTELLGTQSKPGNRHVHSKRLKAIRIWVWDTTRRLCWENLTLIYKMGKEPFTKRCQNDSWGSNARTRSATWNVIPVPNFDSEFSVRTTSSLLPKPATRSRNHSPTVWHSTWPSDEGHSYLTLHQRLTATLLKLPYWLEAISDLGYELRRPKSPF